MKLSPEQQKKFAENVSLMEDFDIAFKEKTSFKKKFNKILNKELDNAIISFPANKDKYRAKKIAEYKEIALLLLSDEIFLNDLKILTKKWDLDKCRYHLEDNYYSEINRWENKLIAETLKLKLGSAKQNKILPPSSIPIFQFKKDIEELLIKYNLSRLWENSIEALLLTGYLKLPKEYCRGVISFSDDGNPLLFIEITPTITLKDIKNKWKKIEEIKNQIYPLRKKRIKETKNIEEIVETEGNYGKRWDLVEKQYSRFDKRIMAIESLRKSEKRLSEKRQRMIKEGLKRKLASLPPGIKELEECFGRLHKEYYF